YSRIGLWVAAAFAATLAVTRQSVIDLWHDLGSITTPALLLPVGTALLGRGRIGPRTTRVAMVIAFLVSLIWVLTHYLTLGRASVGHPWSIEPIYAGLAASLLVYAVGWLFRKETPS